MKIISLPPDDPYSLELYEQLDIFNDPYGVERKPKHDPFLFCVKDDTGKILGGAQGGITAGGGLYLYSLYSTREVKGIGTFLMDHVENYARERNCKGVGLNTYEFQAVEFYRKRGYEICGRFPDFSQYEHIYMRKVF